MSIETMWRDEIESELEELSKIEVGTDKHRTAVENVTKLMDRYYEGKKIETENDKFYIESKRLELEQAKLDDEKKDRNVKNVLTAVSIATGVGMAIWGTLTSMRFEKEDSFTSLLGRKWVDKTMSFMKK